MIARIAELVHLDFAPRHRQPPTRAVVVATVVALAASLGADALLVAGGEALWPSTIGYVHFRFTDYAKLTVIGVLIACGAWPITTRITSMPRWMFFRMAVAVTLVLYLPDLYLLVLGAPVRAVAVLMVMHIAIALVTYNALVRLAPVRSAARARRVYARR